MALNTFARHLSKWKHNTYISMWSPPQNSHLPLNINTFVICTQVILGYGRVRSVHKMYTSFSWEMKGAFEVAFEIRKPSSRRGDAFALQMRSSKCAFWLWDSLRRDAVTQSHFTSALRSPHTSVWDTLRRATVTHSHFKCALRSPCT